MLHRILAVGFIATSLLAVPATSRAQGTAGIKTNCKEDIQRLCKDIKPGGGRILQCLAANEKDISAGCAKAMQDLKAKKQGQ